MQTFLMLAILLSLVASLILLLVFHDMKIDNRKWHMNIAIFVCLFLLVNALAYSYEAERGKPAYFQMPDVSLGRILAASYKKRKNPTEFY